MSVISERRYYRILIYIVFFVFLLFFLVSMVFRDNRSGCLSNMQEFGNFIRQPASKSYVSARLKALHGIYIQSDDIEFVDENYSDYMDMYTFDIYSKLNNKKLNIIATVKKCRDIEIHK